VTDDEAIETARRLAREEGMLSGSGSGAAVAVALRLGGQAEFQGKNHRGDPAGRGRASTLDRAVENLGGESRRRRRRLSGQSHDALAENTVCGCGRC